MNAFFQRPLRWILRTADTGFLAVLAVVGSTYILLILGLLLADLQFLFPDVAPALKQHGLSAPLRITWDSLWPEAISKAVSSPEIRYSIKLSLITCTVSTILSLVVGIPLGYLLARTSFVGKTLVDAVLDIPIVLPPLVLGLSLLILFQTQLGKWFDGFARHWGGDATFFATIAALLLIGTWLALRLRSMFQRDQWLAGFICSAAILVVVFAAKTATAHRAEFYRLYAGGITFQIPSIVLAQFTVSCAFAARTMRITFEQINPRTESVAMTLGCTRAGAFWRVGLPQARRGIITAASIAWARALGEFGPILVFAGATRMRTEVLPTTVFLELSIGNIEAAVAVSMIMVVAALIVLLIMRAVGIRGNRVV